MGAAGYPDRPCAGPAARAAAAPRSAQCGGRVAIEFDVADDRHALARHAQRRKRCGVACALRADPDIGGHRPPAASPAERGRRARCAPTGARWRAASAPARAAASCSRFGHSSVSMMISSARAQLRQAAPHATGQIVGRIAHGDCGQQRARACAARGRGAGQRDRELRDRARAAQRSGSRRPAPRPPTPHAPRYRRRAPCRRRSRSGPCHRANTRVSRSPRAAARRDAANGRARYSSSVYRRRTQVPALTARDRRLDGLPGRLRREIAIEQRGPVGLGEVLRRQRRH